MEGDGVMGQMGTRKQFSGFEIDLDEQRLWIQRSGGLEEVRLAAQTMSLLGFFVRNAHRLVTRDQLRGLNCWADEQYVVDSTMTKAVNRVRDVLKESGKDLIETRTKQGWILAADVSDALVDRSLVEISAPYKQPADVDSSGVVRGDQRNETPQQDKAWQIIPSRHAAGLAFQLLGKCATADSDPSNTASLRPGFTDESFSKTCRVSSLPPAMNPAGALPLRNPTKLIGRESLVGEISAMLRVLIARNSPDSRNVVSLQGSPGIGKTAIAVAIAHDSELHATFTNGIYWESIGKRADPLAIVSRWSERLQAAHLLDGLRIPPGANGRAAAAKDLGSQLRAFLLRAHKRVLFLLDDVWDASHVESILIGEGHCASLITTRNLPIHEHFAPNGQRKEPPPLSEEQSLELLSEHVGAPQVARYGEAYRELARRLSGLPLALTVAGRFLASATSRGHDVEDLIVQLRDRTDLLLRQPAPPDVRQFLADVANPDVVALFQLSTDELDEGTRELFAVLGDVAPPDNGLFGLDGMALGWGIPKTEARRVLDRLVEAGLIQPAKEIGGDQFYFMHDLIIQHAKTMIEAIEE